eukprot:7662301-Pyramimonas_sp.AAC.1
MMRSRVAGAMFHMCTRHRLQAHPAFHSCWVQCVGMLSKGGSPVSLLRGAPFSRRHMKQPSGGLSTDRTS